MHPWTHCIFAIMAVSLSINQGTALSTGYIGCYKDKRAADKAMKVEGSTTPDMTLDICRRRCLNYHEHTYMGTEYHFGCYCGDSYDKYGRLSESRCNTPCSGNRSQTCGGDDALSVHTVCPIGYYGLGCTERCHCLNEVVCPRKYGTCLAGDCATGWKGLDCSKDINECITNNHTCETDHALGWCNNTVGSYRCECNQGYRLTENNKCEDRNECLTNNGDCDQGCVNTGGSYHCSCSLGYLLNTDEHKCDDINECLNGNGGCSHTCSNTEGSYTCGCRTGFKLVSDLQCQDVDECENSSLHTCYGDLGVCINKIGWYECDCKKGYQLRNSKLRNPRQISMCEDIDECADAICGWNKSCTNTVGSYICHCEEKYYLSRDLTTCLATSDLIYASNLWRICLSVACMLGIIVIAIMAHRLIGWYRNRNATVAGCQDPYERNYAVKENVIIVEDYVPGNGLYHTPSEEDQYTQTEYEELQRQALNEADCEQSNGAGREEHRNHSETQRKIINC